MKIVINKAVIIASMTKIIINHFAISIEKPAIPVAPNTYAMNANIKKNIARPIKLGIIEPPSHNQFIQRLLPLFLMLLQIELLAK